MDKLCVEWGVLTNWHDDCITVCTYSYQKERSSYANKPKVESCIRHKRGPRRGGGYWRNVSNTKGVHKPQGSSSGETISYRFQVGFKNEILEDGTKFLGDYYRDQRGPFLLCDSAEGRG